jgi:hypothetical protein
VHLTLGILRTSQAVFYALAFFWLDGFAAPAQVTQAVGRQSQRANTKPFLIRMCRFAISAEIQNHFLAAALFQVSGLGQYFFSKQVFKFGFFVWLCFLLWLKFKLVLPSR